MNLSIDFGIIVLLATRTNPMNFSELEQIIEPKNDEVAQLKIENDTLKKKVIWFEEQFKLLKHQRFAKSSEKQTVMQLSLFDEDETAIQSESNQTETITYTRKKKNRPEKLLDTRNLPREKRIIDLDDSEKYCECGQCLEKFGEETKEELEFIPASLKVIEHVRYKYTCRRCESVKMPKAVELPLSKSKAGAGLITDIILNKYAYHLPFYRQSNMLENHHIHIPDNTLAGWVMRTAECLEPIYDALWQQLSTISVLQADETPVKVLEPDKKAYMWLYHSPTPGKRFILFDFNLSRAAHVVDQRLKPFKGLLQTDGYAGYNTQRQRHDIITLGCWDHARRKFADVVKVAGNNKTGKAGQMLAKIATLYDIERSIKALSPDERKLQRQQLAKPKLDTIHTFLLKINAPPKSLLGKAVTYCKNQWPELIRYIDYGDAHISNCLIENQVRPFAVGKRNWLFVGNQTAATRAALLYSLVQSCQLNDIDPRKYFNYLLNQIHAIRRQQIDPNTILPHTIDLALIQ